MTAYYGQRHRTNDKRSMHELNKKLRAVSLAEEESNRRNQELLKTLGKVSKQATTLNNKTERLKQVRGDYEDYISRLYPQWVGYMEKFNQQSPPKEERGVRMRNESPPKETSPSKHQMRPSRSQEKDLYPEFIQGKMNRWRHDTSLDNSPERPFTSPDRPHRNARTSPSYNSHHIGQSYMTPPSHIGRTYPAHPDDFLPPNEFNHRMSSTYRREEPFRTKSEPFLPVGREFEKSSIHREESGKTFTNQPSIHDLLLNNSVNAQNTDLSDITILPQLLGVSQNGQLVLVPLAASVNLNSSLNNTFDGLNGAKQRASPVGQNSESVNQTFDDSQQTVKTNGSVTQNVSVLQQRQNNDHPNSGSFNDRIKAERESQRLNYIELKRLEKEKAKRLQEEEKDLKLQEEKQRWRDLENEIERKKVEEERLKAEKLAQEKKEKEQKQRDKEQEKLLKPQESPALKKQKSPMFSKLKSLAKFSPSTRRDSKQEAPAVVVEEIAKEPSKEEMQENEPPSFFGDDEDLFPDDDSEDENDLRLHSKSMSRAISDIEELSENSSRQTPKKKSPIQSPRSSSEPLKSSSTPQSRQQQPQIQEPSPLVSPLNNNHSSSANDSLTNHPRSKKESSPANHSKTNKDSSLFSDFSDHSEFDLPSNKSVSPPQTKSSPPPSSSVVAKQPARSPSVPALQKQRTFSQDSHGETMDDYQPLLYIMETLTDKVKDEDSEEVLVLNIDINTNQANTIIGTAELEGNVKQFDSSELCMSYRYHLQQLMVKKSDRPFLIHDVDANNDFEGNLRDCVDSCYLEIWDSLFIFLTEIMSAFEFDPVQVATIFANALLPSHEKQRKQVQSSLGKILTHLSEESFETENEDGESEAGPIATNNVSMPTHSNISITEEIHTRGISNTSKSEPLSTTYGGGGKSTTEKGDLSQSLSLENEDENSSTLSFDSDGLPVRRSKQTTKQQDSISQNNSTLSEASSNLNLNGSKAYQEMRHESLMSPVHESVDDDDELEDLLGESIGLNKRPQKMTSSPPPPAAPYSTENNSSTNDQLSKKSSIKMTPSSDLITRSESSSTSQTKNKNQKKMDVKKPDFWDTESESDFDLSNAGRSGNQSSQQQQGKNNDDDDDDFDFDFYD